MIFQSRGARFKLANVSSLRAELIKVQASAAAGVSSVRRYIHVHARTRVGIGGQCDNADYGMRLKNVSGSPDAGGRAARGRCIFFAASPLKGRDR